MLVILSIRCREKKEIVLDLDINLVPQSEYIVLIYKKFSTNFSYSSKMNGMLDFWNKSLLKFLIIHNN